ncbi:GGDEF domain-containing protein [Colwelliaceae bacterium 6471]
MSYFVKGFKNTLLSLVGVFIAFAVVVQTQVYWSPWLTIIEHVVYAALVLTIVFAAQFNRSRFSLLAATWLLIYAGVQSEMPYSSWLKHHNDWLMLCVISLFILLSFIKDRGLLSVHLITRVVLIIGCGVMAYLWLYGYQWGVEQLSNRKIVFAYTAYLEIALPVAIAGLTLLLRALAKASLLDSTLLVSFTVWCLYYYQLVPLPLSVVLTLLSCYYLLVIVIDSYFLAYRDELTGLPSRRALNHLALSLGRKYTVAMLDIDHFKKFNDTYGHDIGDQVLKLVAAKLTEVKSGGKVFRYGGEEFTVVFPRKNIEQSLSALETLRQSIANYKMVIRHPQRKTKQERSGKKNNDMKTVSVTVSIGVAVKVAKTNFEQVLKSADQALYRAKKSGRNNVSE